MAFNRGRNRAPHLAAHEDLDESEGSISDAPTLPPPSYDEALALAAKEGGKRRRERERNRQSGGRGSPVEASDEESDPEAEAMAVKLSPKKLAPEWESAWDKRKRERDEQRRRERQQNILLDRRVSPDDDSDAEAEAMAVKLSPKKLSPGKLSPEWESAWDKRKRERDEQRRRERQENILLDRRVSPDDDSDADNDKELEKKRDEFRRSITQHREEEAKDPENADELEMLPIDSGPIDDESQEDEDQLNNSGASDGAGVEVDQVRISTVEQFEIDETDVETGRSGSRYQRRRSEFDCVNMPIPLLRWPVNFVARSFLRVKDGWPEYSSGRRFIVVFTVLFVIGLILTVSLLPPSFVYVDYDKMGFVKNSVTGAIDYDEVYEYGCFLLAPQYEMVLFPATAHFLDVDTEIFNKDGLTIGLEIHLQYFLRPKELARLYLNYHDDYDKLIRLVATSTIKNKAVQFTMDEFRLNRSSVETELFKDLKYVLSGDCCHSYHANQFPTYGDTIGSECDSSPKCNRGKNVDVAFFQMGAITIPDEVLNRYMKQELLEMELEEEFYKQEKGVVEMKTTMLVRDIWNEAREIKETARAERRVIEAKAEAERFINVQKTYATALKEIFSHFNINKEDEKTTLMYLKALKDIKEKDLLAFSYNYESLTSP